MRSGLTAAVPWWSITSTFFTIGHSTRTIVGIRRSALGGRRQPGYRRKVDPAIAHQSAVQWRKASRNPGDVAIGYEHSARSADTVERCSVETTPTPIGGGPLSKLCGLRADAGFREGSDAAREPRWRAPMHDHVCRGGLVALPRRIVTDYLLAAGDTRFAHPRGVACRRSTSDACRRRSRRWNCGLPRCSRSSFGDERVTAVTRIPPCRLWISDGLRSARMCFSFPGCRGGGIPAARSGYGRRRG